MLHENCQRYNWYHLFISKDRSNVDKTYSTYDEAPERTNREKNCLKCPYKRLCNPESRAVIPRANCLSCGHLGINHINGNASCSIGLKYNKGCDSHCYKPDLICFDQPINWHQDNGSLEYSDWSNGREPVSDDKQHFTSQQLEEMFTNV